MTNSNVDPFTFVGDSKLPEPSEPFLRMQNSISPFLRILIGCAIGASFLQSDMSASTYHLFVFIRDSSLPRRSHSDFIFNYSTIGRVVISFPLEYWQFATEIRRSRRIQVCMSNFFSKKYHQHEPTRLSHVPLTLLYSSLTKLFLLLLLTLWKPSSGPVSARQAGGRFSFSRQGFKDDSITQCALELLDDDKLDREWVIRNVLGGMAAGFGLRGRRDCPSIRPSICLSILYVVVVLDIQPAFTTVIVLTGWVLKTFVANLLLPWVSKSESGGDVFLAYSIP